MAERSGGFLLRAFAKTKEFLDEVKAEMIKVAWPSRHEIVASTWVVIFAVVIISVWIFAADQVSNAAMATLIGIFR
jgi:preprotein translocase subunit SecE